MRMPDFWVLSGVVRASVGYGPMVGSCGFQLTVTPLATSGGANREKVNVKAIATRRMVLGYNSEWDRPSACGGLSGRPDGLSITYSGFSTERGYSRTLPQASPKIGNNSGRSISKSRGSSNLFVSTLPMAESMFSFTCGYSFSSSLKIPRNDRRTVPVRKEQSHGVNGTARASA